MAKPKASTEKRKALKALSDYIRERDKWICYTCGIKGDKYTIDAGHLISRYWAATLFDEDNVNAQCKPCNEIHENNPEIYKSAWILRHGIDAYWDLYRKSKQPAKRKAQDYINLRLKFEAKLRWLKEER